jgi:hypothetical protein
LATPVWQPLAARERNPGALVKQETLTKLSEKKPFKRSENPFVSFPPGIPRQRASRPLASQSVSQS